MTRDPRAVRFVDWWARNAGRYPDAFWFELFDFWAEPFALRPEESHMLFLDCSDEYHERENHDPGVWGNWIKAEPVGMVVTDFENIPDTEQAA